MKDTADESAELKMANPTEGETMRYGWGWIEGEDDDAGTDWISIEPLVVEGGEEILAGDEMAVIICRDADRVRREHPEWIEGKERTATLIVNALNLREEVLDRMAEGFEFPASVAEVAQEIAE